MPPSVCLAYFYLYSYITGKTARWIYVQVMMQYSRESDLKTLVEGKVFAITQDGYLSSIEKGRNVPIKKYSMPSVFSTEGILQALQKEFPPEMLCKCKHYIRLKCLFDLINETLEPQEDVEDLLYVIFEVYAKVSNRKREFLSEGFLQALRDLGEMVGEERAFEQFLKNKDYEGLKEEMLTGYWETEDEQPASAKIATFTRHPRKLEFEPVSLEEGLFLGNQIVPCVQLSKNRGIVSYDVMSDRFCVNCPWKIAHPDEVQIKDAFDLSYRNVDFVIQTIPTLDDGRNADTRS